MGVKIYTNRFEYKLVGMDTYKKIELENKLLFSYFHYLVWMIRIEFIVFVII